MYAIVEMGGKQFRVVEGDVLMLDRLVGEAGDVVRFERVLLVGGDTLQIGAPLVEGAVVSAKILEHGRDRNKLTFRYKNKNRYRVKKGHRQPITRVQVETISL